MKPNLNLVLGQQPITFKFRARDVFYIDKINKRLHIKAVVKTRIDYAENKTFLVERIKRLKFSYMLKGQELMINQVPLISLIEDDLINDNIDNPTEYEIKGQLISDIEDIMIIENLQTNVYDLTSGLILDAPFSANYDNIIDPTQILTPHNITEIIDSEVLDRKVLVTGGSGARDPLNNLSLGTVNAGKNITVSLWFTLLEGINTTTSLYKDWTTNDKNLYLFINLTHIYLMSGKVGVKNKYMQVEKNIEIYDTNHIVITRDEAYTRIYFNNVLILEQEDTIYGYNTNNDVLIGETTKMETLDLKIYNRALNQDEVTLLYNDGDY